MSSVLAPLLASAHNTLQILVPNGIMHLLVVHCRDSRCNGVRQPAWIRAAFLLQRMPSASASRLGLATYSYRWFEFSVEFRGLVCASASWHELCQGCGCVARPLLAEDLQTPAHGAPSEL